MSKKKPVWETKDDYVRFGVSPVGTAYFKRHENPQAETIYLGDKKIYTREEEDKMIRDMMISSAKHVDTSIKEEEPNV